ncbi:ABC transporter permease [Methylocystis bryophila]|uniref:ABC transporter permease n=1 Tax=Methylocystis bryophila TaxID=655015 RepID=A0A1W6MTE1_9HYPH|nr:ABC transporter permease [Methylocystis bryophila]ARN80759.1 ABC transporter permease [Methylocystis bryophila]BDV40836.1 ABC transporter permease [Methylocystis bryophila]
MTRPRAPRFLLLRLAAQNVGRRLLRSLFLGLAVMIAVGVGFSGSVLGWTFRHGVVTSFSRMGADLVIVPQGALVNITSTLLTVQPTDLDLDESLGAVLRALPGVAKVAPQRLVRAGAEGRAINLIAYDPAQDFTVQPWLPAGQPTPSDPSSLLVGARGGEKPGDALTICGRTLIIAGRLSQTGVGPLDESLFISFAGLDALAAAARGSRPASSTRQGGPHEHHEHHGAQECLPDLAPGRVTAFLIQLAPDASPIQARFAIGQIPGVKIVVGNPVLTAARQSLGALLWGVTAFAGLLLLSLLFVVSLLFSAIVQERFREIGMLRAMGARPGQIVSLTLMEAVLLTGLGSVIGVGFGFLLIFVSARSLGAYFDSLGAPFEGPSDAFVLAAATLSLCCGVLLGVLGALVAGRHATRLDPYRMIQMESAP